MGSGVSTLKGMQGAGGWRGASKSLGLSHSSQKHGQNDEGMCFRGDLPVKSLRLSQSSQKHGQNDEGICFLGALPAVDMRAERLDLVGRIGCAWYQ